MTHFFIMIIVFTTFFSIHSMEIVSKKDINYLIPFPTPCHPCGDSNMKEELEESYRDTIQFCLNSTELNNAAFKGNLSRTKMLFSRQKDIPASLNPLMCAVAGGHRDVVILLANADPNAVHSKDPWNRTALFFTVHGNADLFDELLSHSASIIEGNFLNLFFANWGKSSAAILKHFSSNAQTIRESMSNKKHIAPGVKINEIVHELTLTAGENEARFNLLNYAILMGNSAIVRKIIATGVGLNFSDHRMEEFALETLPEDLFQILFREDLLTHGLFGPDTEWYIERSRLYKLIRMTGSGRTTDSSGTKCIASNEKLRFALSKLVKKTNPKNARLLQAIISNRPDEVKSHLDDGISVACDGRESVPADVLVAMVGSPEVLDTYMVATQGLQIYQYLTLKIIDPFYIMWLLGVTDKISGAIFNKVEQSLGIDGADALIGFSPVHWAAAASNYPVLIGLKKYGVDYNGGTRSPLWFAAKTGTLQTVETLLELGAQPNASQEALLCQCIDNPEMPKIVPLLLIHGASLKDVADHPSCRFDSTCNEQNPFIEVLIKSGVDLNQNDGLLLRTVLSKGPIEAVFQLLAAGVQTDHTDEKNASSIHFAANLLCKDSRARSKGVELIKELRKRGAEIDAQDDLNKTALEHSLDSYCAVALVPLLRNNASINSSMKAMNNCPDEIKLVSYCAMTQSAEACTVQTRLLEKCLEYHKTLPLKGYDLLGPSGVAALITIILFCLCCK